MTVLLRLFAAQALITVIGLHAVLPSSTEGAILFDGQVWYTSGDASQLSLGPDGELLWSARRDRQITTSFVPQDFSNVGDVVTVHYPFMFTGTDTGDDGLRIGLFDSRGAGHVSNDNTGVSQSVWNGYYGYQVRFGVSASSTASGAAVRKRTSDSNSLIQASGAWTQVGSTFNGFGMQPGSVYDLVIQATRDSVSQVTFSVSANDVTYTAVDTTSSRQPQQFDALAMYTISTWDADTVTLLPGTGPTHHWRLDETTGTTALNAAGGTDGTFVAGAVTLGQPGMVGTAYQFTPTSTDFGVSVGTGVFPTTGDFTFAAWFQGAANDRAIFGTTDTGRVVFDFKNGRLRVLGVGTEFLGTTTLTTSSDWHHAMVTRSGNDWMIWIDGMADMANPAVRSYTVSSALNYRIGSRNDWHSNTVWTGVIDDVGIWDRALSAQEIAAVHALGLFQGLDLQHEGIYDLLGAYDAQGEAMIDSTWRFWRYTTGLPGGIGATGGSVAGLDAFVVLGADGSGMMLIPEPGTTAMLSFGLLALLLATGRRKR